MSLIHPPQSNLPGASEYARANYKALKRVDPRGDINQIATTLVLKNLEQIRELEPTLWDGVKSNMKALGCYVAGAAGGTAVFGGLGYLAWTIAKTQFSWQALAMAVTAEYLLEKKDLGITNLSLAYILAVHETAKRAAKWSTKQDERTQDQKMKDASKCREVIHKQLESVYNDCGKHLEQKAANIDSLEKRVKFRQNVVDFEKKLPLIENMLRDLGLNKAKSAEVLQGMKNRILHAKESACELSPKPKAKDQNLEILSHYNEEYIHDIAVPGEIRRRIGQARAQQMGCMAKLSGYANALWSGVKAGVTAALAVAALERGWIYYAKGAEALLTMPQLVPAQTAGCVAAIAIPTIAVIAKECAAHSRKIRDKAEFVEKELSECKDSLRAIYQNVGDLEPNKITPKLQRKFSLIQNEIQKLGLVNDPKEIFGSLNQAVC